MLRIFTTALPLTLACTIVAPAADSALAPALAAAGISLTVSQTAETRL